jgi:histone H3/H4
MVRKSKKEEAPAKKVTHKSEHIVITSAGNVLHKAGQESIADVRISKKAARQAAKATGKMLARFGTEVNSLLQLVGRKTVKPEDLMHCAKAGTCGFEGAAAVIQKAAHTIKNKGTESNRVKVNRIAISMESAYSAFCDGFGDRIRITEKARTALAELAVTYLILLGARAVSYTKERKGKMIMDRDIVLALGCVDPHHV